MKYDFTAIEKKWQKVWADGKVFAAENGSDKEKFYALVEFPYPSGARTYCSPSALMPLACPRRTLQSRIMCIRPL